MNKSNRRLKTIESQEPKKHSQSQIIPIDQQKSKKQSTRKISLKQSVLKQHRDLFVPQLHPKSKKSHQVTIDNDQKYKIVKQLQHQTNPDENRKNSLKFANPSKNNKSLIYSEHKLIDPYYGSNLKASKLIPSSNKAGSTVKKSKDNESNYKKVSKKGSTAKKHSRSVYNYTQFDDYIETKHAGKKHHTKESQTHNSRQFHNRSSMTQHPHQISTSSITKRVTKSKQILNKLLHNSDIKKKTSHFKILSNCLRTYVKEEKLMDNKVDVGQIIKLVKAFNKAEISKMSRPLEELIGEIVRLIQDTVDGDGVKCEVSEQKATILKYETPQRMNSKSFNFSSKNKPKQFSVDTFENQNPADISKTKKFYPDNYDNLQKDHDQITEEEKYPSNLSMDLHTMQQGLQELRSESNQLKRIIHESSSKKRTLQKYKQRERQHQQNEQKRLQINKLKEILQRQKFVMEKMETFSDQERDGVESFDSSLKCFPVEERQ